MGCAEDKPVSEAKQAVQRAAEPAAAQFKDAKVYKWNDTERMFVCGMADAKNRQGGYNGFAPLCGTNRDEQRGFIGAPWR
jgi:hypothetical protein